MCSSLTSWGYRLAIALSACFALPSLAQTNIALNKPTSSNSVMQAASLAVDGNGSSRWESVHGVNPVWLQVDLGSQFSLSSMAIDWEAANAANYEVLGSVDGANWVSLSVRSGGTFGNRTDNISLSGNYRFLRINCTARSAGNSWGYSIWEWRVNGSPVVASSSSKSSVSSSVATSSSSNDSATNVALNKATYTSTAMGAGSLAVDGNFSTRWESAHGIDPSWITVDLGSQKNLQSAVIYWEAANAATYEIQGSNDNSNWSTLASRSGGTFGNRTDTISISGNYRYVRMYGTSRSQGNSWGYSIYEFQVFAVGGAPVSSASSSSLSSSILSSASSSKSSASSVVVSSSSSSRVSSASSQSSVPVVTNLALYAVTSTGPAITSSSLAVDGNMSTRWESTHGVDPAWLVVDLGGQKNLQSAVIYWEAANAATYEIQGSNDNFNWVTLASRAGGTFGNRTDTISLSGNYRYVRMYGTSRSQGNSWGYSIYEFEIYGTGGTPVSSSSSSRSSSVASSSSSSDRNLYNAPRATTAPIIDGVMDAVWNNAPWAPIDVFWLGSQVPNAQDFSGRYKVMWDQNQLYLLFDITDDVIFDATANPLDRYWDDDSVEIFIDENKNGGNHQYNTSAWAYHIGSLGDVVDYTNSTSPKLLNNHFTLKRVSNGNKHLWEMSMRVYGENYNDAGSNTPVTLYLNKLLGFSACYNDNDASAYRESMVGSVDTAGHRNNMGYIDASVFGSLRLVETAQ